MLMVRCLCAFVFALGAPDPEAPHSRRRTAGHRGRMHLKSQNRYTATDCSQSKRVPRRWGSQANLQGRRRDLGPLRAGPIAVDGVGDEYGGAHDAGEGDKCFQHGNDPATQRRNLTACGDTQSKGFQRGRKFSKRDDDFQQHRCG
jgi:hypothetical protein